MIQNERRLPYEPRRHFRALELLAKTLLVVVVLRFLFELSVSTTSVEQFNKFKSIHSQEDANVTARCILPYHFLFGHFSSNLLFFPFRIADIAIGLSAVFVSNAFWLVPEPQKPATVMLVILFLKVFLYPAEMAEMMSTGLGDFLVFVKQLFMGKCSIGRGQMWHAFLMTVRFFGVLMNAFTAVIMIFVTTSSKLFIYLHRKQLSSVAPIEVELRNFESQETLQLV